MEEFIDTILPPQSGDDEDKDLLPQDVIKTLNAPAQLYIPPIPDIMLTEGQNLHFTDFDVHAEHKDEDKAYVRLVVQQQITQSDTGANRHLSNSKDTLTDFESCYPFPIGTIEENATVTVTGKGKTSIRTTDPLKPLEYETLYSPKASGSVFSPQKYALDNKATIRIWSQFADITNNTGGITFYGHDKKAISTIPLYPRNGLWYMKINQ